MDNRLIFADDLPDSTLHDRVNRGDLVRLARGASTPPRSTRTLAMWSASRGERSWGAASRTRSSPTAP